MDSLFLTRLKLTEFRTFSKGEVELPDGPGILLVSGPNGLGKSTLFDGLEWCLAGEVDRFASAGKGVDARNYLRRWNAPADITTSVEATFSGDHMVRRSLTAADPIGQVAGANPVDLLRAENWTAKIGLHHYLLLTHFLGQSAITRMTHREARDRWEYLKGPAQSDWAQEIAAVLHGHGNSGEAKAYAAAVRAAQETAAHIEQLLQTEQDQFEAAHAAGGLSAEQVVAEARDAIGRLSSGNVVPAPTPVENATPAARLDQLAGVISTARSWLTQREADLERGRNLLAAYTEAQSKATAAQRTLVGERTRLRELEAQRLGLNADLEAARKTADEAQTTLERGRRRVRALERLREMLDAASRLKQDVAANEADAARLADKFKEADARVNRSQRRLALAQQAQATRSKILDEIQAASVRLLAYDELAELDGEIEHRTAALEARVAQAPNLADMLTSAQATRSAAADQAEAARAGLASARQAVGELTSAVIRVTAHIDKTTCACPICATEFEPGELHRRAISAANAIGPSLAPLETLAQNREKELNEATARLRQLETEHLVIESERQNLGTLRAQRDARRAQTGGLEEDIKTGREGEKLRITRLQARGKRFERWLTVLGTPGALQEAWSSELDARRMLERQIAQARQTRLTAEQALRNAEEDLASSAAELGMRMLPEGDMAQILAEAREAEALAESRYADSTRSMEQASMALEQNARALEACAEREQEISTDIQSIEKTGQISREAWLDLEFSDDPNIDALNGAGRAIEAVRSRLGFAEQNLLRLREGYTIGLQQAAHARTLSELRKQVGASPDTDRQGTRDLAAKTQAKAAKRARNFNLAQEIAQRASTTITQQVGAFSRNHLRPVNELMTRINRAILTEPEVGLELEFQRNAVLQRTRRLSKAPPSVDKLDPRLVHSEGQMAALAVSMLCAASMTFPWSRWRALVLDDPLQHNDVVHASAFADLMRVLVSEEHYQVLLSTHDAGLADFLRRKFAAGGISCTTVHLVGQGDEGTETEISQSNGSAKPAGQYAAG
ncbi:MAG: AAA family ATPase [Allosphingosinicella sp.]|uniref:AAA family ATPase n=1 Tax=Allosphingosinicella sp. TaxID=2823234 RepID=UPI003947F826